MGRGSLARPRRAGPRARLSRGGASWGRAGRLCLLPRVSYIVTKVVPPLLGSAPQARPPPAVADMEPVASNIQVLLQAAEFLERRERGEEEPLVGLQAATSLTLAWAGLDSGLGRMHGLGAVVLRHRRAQLKRGSSGSGLEGLGKWPCSPESLSDGAVPGAPAGTSLTLAGTLSGRGRTWLCVPVPAPESRSSPQEEEAVSPSSWRAGQWAVRRAGGSGA